MIIKSGSDACIVIALGVETFVPCVDTITELITSKAFKLSGDSGASP